MTQAGNRFDPSTWPDDLRRAMSTVPATPIVHVALSGGLDSIFLLNATQAWFSGNPDATVRAIHVNHQLQAAAAEMVEQCESACRMLKVALETVPVTVAEAGESLESAARAARYQAFEDRVGAGECLVLAHHADDQAETVLFRLIRGSGTRGLAGMPRSRPLGQGQLFRPLLTLSRARIREIAEAWHLAWHDDPTNADTRFDRNYLRHCVIGPVLERWPGALQSIGRAARQCGETDQLARTLANLQRETIEDTEGRLAVARLAALSQPEQKNLLRWWIIDQGHEPPSAARLEQGLADLLNAGADKLPDVRGPGYHLYRYQGYLYCVVAQPMPPATAQHWNTAEPLAWAGRELRLVGSRPAALQLTVTARQGGERLRPRPGGPSRPLKKWLQEQGVPPWERECIPLVWKDGELVAVAGIWVSPALVDVSGFASWRIVWERECR